MSNAHDRRAPGTSRLPFDAMVELAGALGPSFEAQAVNLSEEGMSFRTAYLPEIGQPVMCRFDAGNGMSVTAAGEVVWKEDMGEGGEFGIRFTNLDGASTVALQRIMGMAEDGGQMSAAPEPGRKVRLHIEGLASPMRARIKDQMKGGVTAYTELGFLRMDRPLQLEDATSGNRRPALIERVEVEMDGISKIPQLVVGLRYDDAEGRQASMSSLAAMEVPVDATPHDEASEMDHMNDEVPGGEPAMAHAATSAEDEEDDAPNKFKLAMAKVTPAILSWATRAKTAAALLAARARRAQATGDDVEIPVRRTTAPAPGGGLHAEGRKVVRGGLGSIHEERFEDSDDAKPKLKITKKKAVIVGSIGLAAILVFIAMRKPSNTTPPLASAPADTSEGAPAIPPGTPANLTPAAAPAPVAPPTDPLAAAAAQPKIGKPGKPTPFTNGPVGTHPTTIKIKMDGPVEAIQGATQPSGFTIVTPNRKSLEPAAALAEKDARLAGLNVSNEPTGAELTVTFKDGVPNYIVRAKGDTLELVFAGASAHAEKSQAHHDTKKKAAPHPKKH